MPVPFDSAICIIFIIIQTWTDLEQVYSVSLYLVTVYESQHHLRQQGTRTRRVRPRGPLVASQDCATQTDPQQFGTVAEVDHSSAAVIGQAAPAILTTGNPEVPVPHTAGQQDSGYGSPGQMYEEQQQPADMAGDGSKVIEQGADGPVGQADGTGGGGL